MRQASPNEKTIIKGKRVVLRLPVESDGAEFLAVNRRSAKFNRGLASPPTTMKQFETFVNRNAKPDGACFLICRAQDGAVMGSIALEANIQPENTPSIALVKRAGFVKEGYSRRYLKVSGRWRDHERWAILVEDWRRRIKK